VSKRTREVATTDSAAERAGAATSAATTTPKTTEETTTVRAALAVVAACTSAIALYALLRIAQKLLFSEPDPALVLWSEHAGFFWRAWTAAYVGGTGGFVAWVASGRDAAKTARVLASSIVVSALLVAAQGALLP